ncbi:MAG: fumarylacetoacetase, partial [Hydrogenophaga sp.]
MELNHTHDANTRSWLESANAPGTDFPIQNLPFGVFRRKGSSEAFRGGVAIGDQVIDLAAIAQAGAVSGPAAQAVNACTGDALNDFLALGPSAWRALRHALFDLLKTGASGPGMNALRASLVPQAEVEHRVPKLFGEYTEFYTSIH